MAPRRSLSRRSFLARIGGGVALGGSLGGCVGFIDSDPYDPVGGGYGQGRRYRGHTDNDAGRYADPPGRGRGGGRSYSDSDSGPYADPAGAGRRGGGGRRGEGCTDSDRGRRADPVGRGRHC